MSDCHSRFTLVRFTQGDVGESEHDEMAQHIRSCSKCARIVNEIRTNEAAYFADMDRHQVRLKKALADEATRTASAPQQEATPIVIASAKKNRSTVHLFIPLAAAAAMVLSLYFLPQFKTSPRTDIAYKGGFAVSIVADRQSEQFELRQNNVLHENDALRFQVQTSDAGYLYIFNRASNGTVTGLYPFEADAASPGYRIETAGEHLLPDSVVMDHSKGKESIAIVFSRKPLNIGLLNRHAADIVQKKSLPPELDGMECQVFQIVKE